MKSVKYILFICFWGYFCGCSEDDNFSLLDLRDNYFAVSGELTDPESMLRRSFYEETGVHLLFNDTLRKEYRGTDRYGEAVYFVETVNYGYYLTNMLDSKYLFNYFTELEEQQAAVDFVCQRVFSSFSSKLYPYSLLLAKRIDAYQLNGDEDEYVLNGEDLDYISGWKGIAISLRDILHMTEEEKNEYAAALILQIVSTGIAQVEESEFVDFFSWADGYYEQYALWVPLEDIRSVGFLGYRPGLLRQWYSKVEDQTSYVKAILGMTEEEFMAENGAFPACVAKWNEMKRILLDLGLQLN